MKKILVLGILIVSLSGCITVNVNAPGYDLNQETNKSGLNLNFNGSNNENVQNSEKEDNTYEIDNLSKSKDNIHKPADSLSKIKDNTYEDSNLSKNNSNSYNSNNLSKSEEYCFLASYYYTKEDYQNAKYYFKKAINEDPDSYNATFGLALTEARLGNYQSAKKYAKLSIELDPENYLGYLILSGIQCELGEYKEAYSVLGDAYQYAPTEKEKDLIYDLQTEIITKIK